MSSRRRFLQSLGLGGVHAGLGGLGIGTLGWRAALANSDTEAPKRMIMLNHNHGWVYDSWKMIPNGLSAENDWELDLSNLSSDAFSPALAPLYDHRHRLLALDGTSLATAELDMDGFRHETGWIQSWTGNWVSMTSDGFSGSDGLGAQSASLDQIVASHVARSDRLPSIEMAVNYGAGEEGRDLVYGFNGQHIPLEDSPLRLWERIFGPSVAPDPLLSRHQQAFDFARAEYVQVASRLGVADRQKLDAHFDLVHAMSQRLQGMAGLSCSAAPDIAENYASFDDTFDAFSELIAAAFSCDVTRVATISLGCMPTADFGWDHLSDDVHKGLAHQIYIDSDCQQAMTDYLIYHSHQVERLISLLESIPDSDGRTLMDNTMIVWGSELANGWHGYQHYCPLIIGGDWHFRTGRYMHWAHQTPIQLLVPQSVAAGGYSQFSGIPHQRFLVSAAQAMGLETEQIGIGHVQSQSGDWVDCTSALPDLV